MISNILSNPDAEIDYGQKGKDIKPREKQSNLEKSVGEQIINSVLFVPSMQELMTQDQWIRYFKSRNMQMLSASDIYAIAKKAQSASDLSLEELTRSMSTDGVMTSTRVKYDTAGNEVEFWQHYGPQQKTFRRAVVDHYVDVGLATISRLNVDYLRALFNTDDPVNDKVIPMLERIGNVDYKNIGIRLPDTSEREKANEKAVMLRIQDGFLWVDLNVSLDTKGRAYGALKR